MKKYIFTFIVLLSLLAVVLSACGSPDAVEPSKEEPTAEASTVEEPSADEEEPVAVEPTELTIVSFLPNTAEDPWAQALVQAGNRVVEENYRGLDITFDLVEKVGFPDIERIGREYAKTGEADILVFHTSYNDAVIVLREEFPDQIMSITTSVYGDHKGGSNQYWLDASPVHEASYLCGVLASLMSEAKTIGVVASYPVDSINLPVNAFIDGAKSINLDTEVKISFIESWFDPAKAREAAETQINTGADVIFAMTFGPFEAAAEHGVYGVGIYIDQTYLAPEVVLTSPIALWDPRIKFLIDEWWEHEVNSVPYESPDGAIQFSLAEGGNDIGTFNEDIVPQGIIDQVMEIRQQIIDGEVVVESNVQAPTSD